MDQRCSHQDSEDGDLRHRCAYLQLGRMVAENHPDAYGDRA